MCNTNFENIVELILYLYHLDFGGINNISSAFLGDKLTCISLQTVQFGGYNISYVFFLLEAANVLQELQVWISVLFTK